MTWAAQRDRLQTLIAGITDIGRVHPMPQFGDAIEAYGVTISGIPQLRGWEITADPVGIRTVRLQQGARHRYYPWTIVGYLSVENDLVTYDTAISLAETIANTIELDQANGQILNGAALDFAGETTITPPAPITLGGGPLAWGIQISFETYEVLQP